MSSCKTEGGNRTAYNVDSFYTSTERVVFKVSCDTAGGSYEAEIPYPESASPSQNH